MKKPHRGDRLYNRDREVRTGGVRVAEPHIGKKAGCTFAHTSTFSYQSPYFYKNMGYEVFGVIEDYPEKTIGNQICSSEREEKAVVSVLVRISAKTTNR